VELPLESGNLELVNQLGEWEVGIAMFKQLVYLDLRGNLFEKFPEQVERLEHLEELYLSENKLTEIPSDLGGLESLKILFIQFNKINRISNDLYTLQHLQVSNMSILKS
jgi:Leucine-rich repeat (LRR) protein